METPVAFFIFNRPAYTEKVFAEIRKAKPRKLFIVADGPRYAADEPLCAESRAITERIDWPCDVKRNYAEKNLGLKDRIVSGLNWFFDHVERGIILENDCLPDQSFFSFCGKLLKKYEDCPEVMMISGHNPLGEFSMDYSYDFCRYFSIWGWATWRRAWKQYDIEMLDWPKLKKEHWLKKFYNHNGAISYVTEVFDNVYTGREKTWDTQWFFTCLQARGLCIFPKVNLISNIGVEGVHAYPLEIKEAKTIDTARLIHPAVIAPNKDFELEYFKKEFPYDVKREVRKILFGFLGKTKRYISKLVSY